MIACVCSASYLRRWLLRALLFLAAVQLSSADCPKSCVCHAPSEVHCSFKYLTAIPGHFPPAVERINLGYNSLTILRENDLLGLERLEVLLLHSNTIHTTEDGAFQDLTSLQVLKMSHNKVKEINKGMFKGLDRIQRLFLDHNNIEFINPEAFYGLTNLQLVHLEGNRLQQLHPDTFITLRHSQVFKVSSVRTIHLSDNLLTTLPADILSGCSHLENLFLHGNPWSCDCHMQWFSVWAQRNAGVLKCKRDRRSPIGQLCPVCENPASYHSRRLSLLHAGAFTCTKPWIKSHLKQKNISLEEGDFTPLSPKDFVAPLGSIQINLIDQFHNDASLSCTVQRPTAFENLTQTLVEEEENNVTALTTVITTYLVCNADYEHIHQLWQILAAYSDSPLKLERGLMLARIPEMVYKYSQLKDGEEEITTNIEAEIKASPPWLMQGEVSFQLDRTTTTFSTLHIKYQSVVNLRVASTPSKRERYAWTMIKRDNQTKTEHTVIAGGVAQLSCQIQGEPKPLMEWILPDGSKVRAPYSSHDGRIIITAEGKLTLRGADASDTGLYWCIATNYLDADILIFRLTVLSPDVEEVEVNGLQLSKSLGQNLVFDCSSSGSPEASVSWISPDHSVLDKSQGNKKVYKNGTLFIQGLTARDRGFYRCLVANHLGVDLLVSQVTLTEERLEAATVWDSEGSGMVTEVEMDSSLPGNTTNIRENPTSSPASRPSQESRTIPSNRPYLRPRLLEGRISGSRLGQRRRGVARNRHIWSSRVFDKASRKVDPQTFAEFMKKARGGSRLNTDINSEQVNYENSQNVFSDGSGEDEIKYYHTAVPSLVKSITETITASQKEQAHFLATTEAQQNVGTENAWSLINLGQRTENTNPTTPEMYMQSDSTPMKTTFTNLPRSAEKTEFYTVEKTSMPTPKIQPVTLQLTVTDAEQETQLHFSGEPHAEAETSTGTALSLTTDPDVRPMGDGAGPVELVVHTDPESQTTFTAVTTTERLQDEITFHTTQTIKSPRLSAGSTIISQQHIHIIPRKHTKGRGGRRTLHGRRRIIKPNRINDIKSYINRFKQPTMTREGNTSMPYRTELSTDCDNDEHMKSTVTTIEQLVTSTVSPISSLSKTVKPGSTQKTPSSTKGHYITLNAPFSRIESPPENSTDYITSADIPETDPTIDPLFTTKKESEITTTAASKVVRGRIPWNRLFGGRERQKILNGIKRPYILPKTTTAQATTPAALPTTTTKSPVTSELLLPTIHKQSKESSLDDYGGLASADFELTTLGSSFHHITTTSSPHYHMSSTTAKIPAQLQMLPSPPTVKPHFDEKPDEVLLSGSGGLPDHLVVIRQRPSKTRGQQGRVRRPFQGRGPFRKPGIRKPNPTTIAGASTAKIKVMETTIEATSQSQESVSLYNPSYTTSREVDRVTVAVSKDQTLEETELYDEFDLVSGSFSIYTTTKTPFITSTTYSPTTAQMPVTTKQSYPTINARVHNNIRPQIRKNNGKNTRIPPIRRIRPTIQSSNARGDAKTKTVYTAKQQYDTPPPHNEEIHISISGVYNNVNGNKATTAHNTELEPTTKAVISKPRIIGGNAASFTVLSNSDAYLPCEAVGSPQPVITWKRLSSNTGSTNSIKEKMGRFEVWINGTLSIENANINDRGQYLCLAENDYGSDKLLVTLSVVAYPSRILEPKMREKKSHVGHTVEMNCKAEGRPMPIISWILANRTQVRGQNVGKGRVSVSSEGTLIIEHVSVYDRGYYKCIASNPAGADTATVRLQVVAAPPGIAEEKRQQLKASTNENMWLPCTGHGTPQPTIHWVLYDGSVIQANKRTSDKRMSLYENGTLLMMGVTPADSGKYECIATSSTGSERRVVILTVEAKKTAPEIVKTSDPLTQLSYGDHLRLNCSATGEPEPRIIWHLPSKAVVDHRNRMENRIWVLDNGTLIVNTVSDKDAGDYLCVARSVVGDDLQRMRVSVSMKPAKIEPKLYVKKKVTYGNDLKVDCKASGAPKPEISWGLPDGTMINSALQSDGSHGGGQARHTLFDNGTLYLNQVGISEEGDYTCYAENQVGKDEMHVHVTVVTAAPRIRQPSQTYARVQPGGKIRFDCEALGEPKPKIFWMLPTNDVIAASNEQYLMHVNGSLDIRDVKLNEAGEYVCIARNPGGEDRKVFKLDIDGNPPVINGYKQNRTVIKDIASKHSRKLIDCKAQGDPTPTITWIMPDNIFLRAPYFGSRINVHHNGTLEIRNVRPTDTAEFICIARNDGGEAAMIVQLEVTSMLRRPIFDNPFNERIVSLTGKTTVLNCSADGQPRPEITWILPNGTQFTGGISRKSRYQLGSDGALVIYNSQREDSGNYRCGAKNLVGYVEKLIILNIGQKPYILTRPKGIIRSISGEPLFLHCLSDGNPRPKIYWTIPGGHTLTRPQVLGRYQLFENGTLKVQDTTLHDRGNYICRARNDAGEAMLTVSVTVIAYPPRITSGPPPSMTTATGTPIQLNCVATGIPKPEITWELPDHSVLSAAEEGRPMGSEMLHPQGTLVIQRPTTSDSGKYKCFAKNHHGTDSKITYVLVL
ncbi:immunoglobulin superfamily member 10 [Xenentodon cancila]